MEKEIYTLRDPHTIACSSVRVENGVPVRRFKKEIARLGKYVQKKKGMSFEITELALNNWVAQFNAMKQNGVKVPIPKGVAHVVDNPEHNHGWVDDIFREGDSLFCSCDIIGEDSIELAMKSDVSLYSPPDYTDGKGNQYQRPITHVALTMYPTIPGLSGFEEVAASLYQEEKAMDPKKIAEALGLETSENEVTEEMILNGITELNTKVQESQQSVEAAEAKAAEASKKAEETIAASLEGYKPDPLLVKTVGENRKMKIETLHQAGKVTTHVRDLLVDAFVGDDLALALANPATDKFDAIVKAIGENDMIELREQTGPQVLELANAAAKSKSDGLLVKNAEERAAKSNG